jgi:hypothetical protein
VRNFATGTRTTPGGEEIEGSDRHTEPIGEATGPPTQPTPPAPPEAGPAPATPEVRIGGVDTGGGGTSNETGPLWLLLAFGALAAIPARTDGRRGTLVQREVQGLRAAK